MPLFVDLLPPGRVEGCFEPLRPMLRQADGPSRHALPALAAENGIEFQVDSIPAVAARFDPTFV